MTPRDVIHEPEICPHCGAPSKPRLLVAHIQATVAGYYGIGKQYMKSAQRGWDISHPRQVAMFLAAELTPKSLPDIGRCFNRDHTTVLHAIRAVRRRVEADAELALDVAFLRGRLTPVDIGENPTISKNSDAEECIEQSVNMQVERLVA